MVFSPAWLQGPDVLGIMRAGSEAGLGAARISQNDRESKARIRLGYAQMAASQSSDMARIAASREYHAQALAQNQAEAAAREAEALRSYRGLEDYRWSQEEHRQQQEQQAINALALQTRHQNFLESKPTKEDIYHVGDALVKRNPDDTIKQLFRSGNARLPEYDSKLLGDAFTTKRQATLALADPFKGEAEKAMLTKSIAGADAVLQRFAPPSTNAPALAPALPQPGALPSLGGVTIRDKATGQTFRYRGNPADVPTNKYDIIGQ